MVRIKSKHGDVTDILSLVIVLFVLIVGFFIISFTIPYITNGLRTNGLNNTAEGSNAINSLQGYGTTGIQNGMFFLFIGLCIGVLISAFYTDTHPVWIFLYIIMLGVAIILAAYLGNAYQTIISNDAFGGWQQSLMTSIMQNIMKVVLGVAALSFVIMFVKGLFMGGNNQIP